MTVNDYADLNEDHKDALKELGNIGTGNALTALSRLTEHPIRMELPRIRVVNFRELTAVLDYNADRNAGVVIEVHGDLECVVTFLLNEPFSKLMAEELTGTPLSALTTMDEMQESAIREIGNIMCNAYLNALAAMLEAEMVVSVPNLKIGRCEEILSSFSKEFADEKPKILLIENTFSYLDQEVVSYILLHPKFESLRKILEKLE